MNATTPSIQTAELMMRIRGEYTEMPGLRLTLEQACRLWQLGLDDCVRVLDALVTEGFLSRTIDGAFISLHTATSARARSIKAHLSPRQFRRPA